MRLCALLVVVLAITTAAVAYCGDGIFEYYFEQCDSGMRLIEQSGLSLAWNGIGPTMPAKTVSVSLKYAVRDFVAEAQPQPVYGLTIVYGGTTQAVTQEYGLSCWQPGAAQLGFRVRRTQTGGAYDLQAAILTWVYNTSASIQNCSQFFAARPSASISELSLISFSAQWTGSISSDIWQLSDAATPFGPNTLPNTDCCTNECKLTWADIYGTECTANAGPSNASAAGTMYYCTYNGTCDTEQSVGANYLPSYPLCGNGVIDPGETCDNGIMQSGALQIQSPYADPFSNTTVLNAFTWIDPAWKVPGTVPSNVYVGYVTTNQQPYAQWNNDLVNGNLNVTSTYTFTCAMTAPLQMDVFLDSAQTDPQWFTMRWRYSMPDSTVNCSNYMLYSAPILFDSFFMNYYSEAYLPQPYSNTSSISQATNLLTGDNTQKFAGAACCNAVCNVGFGSGNLCDGETPAIIPPTSGWTCNDVGTCLLTPTQTPTASVGASPSNTASRSPSVSASPSITASPSVSPSASASTGASPSITSSASASITPSPSASTGASPSTTTTLTATGTAVVVPSASATATGTGTATPSPSSINGTNTTASPSQPPVVAESAKTAWIIFSAVAGYAAVALTVVALLMLFMMRQSVLMRRAISVPQPAAPAPLASAATEIATAPLLKTGAERPHFQSRPFKNDTENEWDSF